MNDFENMRDDDFDCIITLLEQEHDTCEFSDSLTTDQIKMYKKQLKWIVKEVEKWKEVSRERLSQRGSEVSK